MAEERLQPTALTSGVNQSHPADVSDLPLNQRTATQDAPESASSPSQLHHETYHDQATSRSFPNTTEPLTTDRSSSDTLISSSSRDGARQEAVPVTSTAFPEARPRKHSEAPSASTASSDGGSREAQQGAFEPIKTAPTTNDPQRPGLSKRKSIVTEEDLFRTLSQRRTAKSDVDPEEERDEVEKLMSRMFGKDRQKNSEEEKTRHSGVVFRDLTVKGEGLGASLQPTIGDMFMGLPRFLKNLFTKGPKAASAKPPVREILSHFDGCVRPGEILLVLGRPGSGCTTFLKAFANQRAGYTDVLGDVTYGGTDAKRMAKDFRGEIIYTPESDLHYATLSVKRTLKFALKTRTPGKESRLEGESRKDYLNEFLRVATKLLWIEHTLDTKVGNEHVRGVSGGERKRVTIAEAMVTRASIQAWDNSSTGLDASTALEYVQSLRTLTNMAQVSTAVSLYQAGESLYKLVDKVLVIHEGQCLYFGSADRAKDYFLGLGFDCPERATTADFLTGVTDEHERTVRKGWEDRIPRSAVDFGQAYRKSDEYQKNLEDIQDYESQLESQRRERLENRSKKNKKKNYTISFPAQIMACTKRQYLVMIGDRASLIGKWGGIVFQALIVGSLFFQLPDTTNGAFTRGGVLFFILLFNALLALAEQTAAFESKPILLKHKSESLTFSGHATY